jgi:general stress protein 26
MAIELTGEERWNLLERNMVMRLATVNPHGLPHVLPIWYLPDREEAAIFFSTPEDSRKVRDVEATPKASLTVDEGEYYFDLQAVVAEGDVSPLDDESLRAAVERRWCQKYFDEPERPEFMDLLYKGRPWRWFRIDPTSWVSWDNSKIDVEQLRERRG